MNPRRTRIAGIVLICTAGLGVILSLGGLIFLVVYAHNISTRVAAGLSDLNSALTITQDGLGAARNALISADAALDSRISTLEAVSAALKGMDPTLQALGSLVGTDLPDTLQATQDALESAQTSAKNVDETLTALSKIPLLGSLVYNPEVPLNETIGGISTSLDSIPPRLQEAKRGLDTLSLNLDTVTLNMDQIASSTEDISASTNASLQVVEDYQQLANNLREEVESMQTALPGQLRLVFLGAALLLIWLGISQIGLLVQGLDLIERARKALIPPGIE